ncbi:helix-turn-helix transcriptional regulator, partial [bacterium]|nr:helix-turn-helix transcriptional regulator [bacterium]
NKIKPIDKTAAYVGRTIYHARRTCHISRDELSRMLGIMPSELSEYEVGTTKIPEDVLTHMFIMGYKMMRVRALESRYRNQRHVFRNLKRFVDGIK